MRIEYSRNEKKYNYFFTMDTRLRSASAPSTVQFNARIGTTLYEFVLFDKNKPMDEILYVRKEMCVNKLIDVLKNATANTKYVVMSAEPGVCNKEKTKRFHFCLDLAYEVEWQYQWSVYFCHGYGPERFSEEEIKEIATRIKIQFEVQLENKISVNIIQRYL